MSHLSEGKDITPVPTEKVFKKKWSLVLPSRSLRVVETVNDT